MSKILPKQGLEKKSRPSASMLPSDRAQYRCVWLETSITVHSDGNVTCGLDDPHAARTFGNIHSSSIADIIGNPEYEALMTGLWNGKRCSDCSLYAQDNRTRPLNPRKRLPTTLVLEPTVRCNLRCPNAACIPNNDASLQTREESDLDFAAFQSIVDQLKNSLRTIYFFNYGDPFMHPQAEDMLKYFRNVCPFAKIATSTNGIPLSKPDRARAVVESGLDYIVFTISGVSQESYSKYHVKGRVDLALKGMQNIVEARSALSSKTPRVIWRYLLFRWNDSESELDAALNLARRIGVDQFSLYLTHMPIDGASYRMTPGSPMHLRYKEYIDAAHGYDGHAPDEFGLFSLENLPGLGAARWTTWRATMCLEKSDGTIVFCVSTLREKAKNQVGHLLISVPWGVYKMAIPFMAWHRVVMRAPNTDRRIGIVRVEILTDDYWFPAEETGTADLRCLGVLIKNDESWCDAPISEVTLLDASEQERSRFHAEAQFKSVTSTTRGHFFDDGENPLTGPAIQNLFT